MFQAEVYIQRRKVLCDKMGSGFMSWLFHSVLIIKNHRGGPCGSDVVHYSMLPDAEQCIRRIHESSIQILQSGDISQEKAAKMAAF